MSEMLRLMALAVHAEPASVAFWFPAVLASLVAGIVAAWVWILGSLEAGVAAGLLTCLAPGFLARTLLGFYDTDLVTLFFPLFMTLAPAAWATRYMLLPRMMLEKLAASTGIGVARRVFGPPASPISAIPCAGSGCFSSAFPASFPGGPRNGIPFSRTSSATMWPCSS